MFSKTHIERNGHLKGEFPSFTALNGELQCSLQQYICEMNWMYLFLEFLLFISHDNMQILKVSINKKRIVLTCEKSFSPKKGYKP